MVLLRTHGLKIIVMHILHVLLHAKQRTNKKQTKYLQDASYCRLKNLTVGYDFPKSWLSFLHVAKAGVYFSAENFV